MIKSVVDVDNVSLHEINDFCMSYGTELDIEKMQIILCEEYLI